MSMVSSKLSSLANNCLHADAGSFSEANFRLAQSVRGSARAWHQFNGVDGSTEPNNNQFIEKLEGPWL